MGFFLGIGLMSFLKCFSASYFKVSLKSQMAWNLGELILKIDFLKNQIGPSLLEEVPFLKSPSEPNHRALEQQRCNIGIHY